MIFTASMTTLVRRALPNKSKQLSISGIIQMLPVSPSGTGGSQMDVLVLGAQDFKGAAEKALADAIKNAHPEVCIIYICTNDKDKALCPPNAHIKVLRRLSPDAIKQTITEIYGQSLADVQQTYTSQFDEAAKRDKNPVPRRAAPTRGPGKDDTHTGPLERHVDPGFDPGGPATPAGDPEGPPPTDLPDPALLGAPMPGMPLPDPASGGLPPLGFPQPDSRALPPTPVENVQAIRSIKDWDALTRQLSRDAIIQDALLRSSEFNSLKQTMEALQVKMNDVIADSHMTNEQKMAALADFGHQRSQLMSGSNARVVDDFLKLWGTVHATASRLVQDRLNEINASVAHATIGKAKFEETLVADGERAEADLAGLATELIGIQSKIIDLYSFAYGVVATDITPNLNANLPSDNAFINSLFGRAVENFYTDNAESLVNKLFQGLREGHFTMTQVQDQITALVASLFNLAKQESTVLAYHKEAMAYLRANHIEDVIIRDTLLKDTFRIIVGTEGTGFTATTCMYAGMMSRRGNTLVIDLTGHPKYDRYGHETVDLDDFLNDRIQRQLLYVTSKKRMDPEQIALMMDALKSRMSYYNCLIVALDASQREELDQLGREALTITYVTNCTADSMADITNCYSKAREIPNVGTILCAIDAPVDASIVINTLHMDVSRTRLVLIPYLRDIKAAAVMHEDPATYGDVLRIFEENFRI